MATRKSKFNLNLEEIYEFHKKFKESPSKVRDAIKQALQKSGQVVEDDYRTKISYALGFKSKEAHANKKTYYEVEVTNGDTFNLRVGHASFIAKFLEVGTRDHYIRHLTRGKNPSIAEAHVRGIRGSKALAKAFKQKYDGVVSEIQKSISEILSNL